MAYQTTRIKILNRPDIQQYYRHYLDNSDYWKDLKERTTQACYAPLAVKRERLVRKEMFNYWLRKWSVLDSILFLVYLWALFVFLNDLNIGNCSKTSENIKSSFTSPTNTCFGLNEIFNNTMLLDYLSNNLIPKLYTFKYYNGQELEDLQQSDMTGYISNYFLKLIGVPRLRQQRVKRSSCKLAVNLTGLEECNDVLQFNEDTSPMFTYESVNENKVNQIKLNEMKNSEVDDNFSRKYSHLIYSKRSTGYSYDTYGRSGYLYSSGGYITLLGRNKPDSLITIHDIKEDNWLDERTRVVFFEAEFYNVHTNMFTIFVIVSENFANGVYMTTAKAFTWTTYENSVEKIIPSVVILIVVLLMTARFIYLYQLYSYDYFRHVSLVTHLLAVITGIISCVLIVINMFMDQLHEKTIKEFFYSNDFIDLYRQFFRKILQNSFLALFTTFTVLRIMFYLQITNTLTIFTKTMEYIVPSSLILIFTFYFFVLALGNITILLQNPVLSGLSFATPPFLEFRQLTKRMLIPQKIFYPFCVCAISLIILYLFRFVLFYYYACATFNWTRNLLALSNNWKLSNITPYQLTLYRKTMLETEEPEETEKTEEMLQPETDESEYFRRSRTISFDPAISKRILDDIQEESEEILQKSDQDLNFNKKEEANESSSEGD